MKRKLLTISTALCLALSVPAFAENATNATEEVETVAAPENIEELKAAYEELWQKFKELEAELKAYKVLLADAYGEDAVESAAAEAVITDAETTYSCASGSLSYDHASIVPTDDGDALIIYCKYTNTSAESASASLTFNVDVFQNGLECDYVYVPSKTRPVELDTADAKVRPNASANVAFACLLTSTEGTVDIEIDELFAFDSTPVSFNIDLADAKQ